MVVFIHWVEKGASKPTVAAAVINAVAHVASRDFGELVRIRKYSAVKYLPATFDPDVWHVLINASKKYSFATNPGSVLVLPSGVSASGARSRFKLFRSGLGASD